MVRWLRRTVLLVLAVLVVASSGIAPAGAGGPTSVLLSAPALPKVLAAGYSDKTYSDLQNLIQSTDSQSTVRSGTGSGSIVRATWLIHDVTVWRVDVIYPDAPGGPLIETTIAEGVGGPLVAPAFWHRSGDAFRLRKLLADLGLLGAKAGDDSPGQVADPPALVEATPPAPDAAATAAPRAAVESAGSSAGSLAGWRWSIPGFLLGAILAAVAVRMLPKRRPWELIDAD